MLFFAISLINIFFGKYCFDAFEQSFLIVDEIIPKKIVLDNVYLIKTDIKTEGEFRYIGLILDYKENTLMTKSSLYCKNKKSENEYQIKEMKINKIKFDDFLFHEKESSNKSHVINMYGEIILENKLDTKNYECLMIIKLDKKIDGVEFFQRKSGYFLGKYHGVSVNDWRYVPFMFIWFFYCFYFHHILLALSVVFLILKIRNIKYD